MCCGHYEKATIAACGNERPDHDQIHKVSARACVSAFFLRRLHFACVARRLLAFALAATQPPPQFTWVHTRTSPGPRSPLSTLHVCAKCHQLHRYHGHSGHTPLPGHTGLPPARARRVARTVPQASHRTRRDRPHRPQGPNNHRGMRYSTRTWSPGCSRWACSVPRSTWYVLRTRLSTCAPTFLSVTRPLLSFSMILLPLAPVYSSFYPTSGRTLYHARPHPRIQSMPCHASDSIRRNGLTYERAGPSLPSRHPSPRTLP